MNKKELYILLQEKERQAEADKPKRAVKMMLLLTIPYFMLLYAVEAPKSLGEIAGTLILAIVTSVIGFFINAFAFNYLFGRSNAEQKEIDRIRKQIAELEEQETKKDL